MLPAVHRSAVSPDAASLRATRRWRFRRLRPIRVLGLLLGGGMMFLHATAPAAGTPLAHANNVFARELMRELSATQGGENFAYSPFSIVTAFGMAYAGARGSTAAQMEMAFGFPGQEEGHRQMRDWLEAVGGAVQGETTTLELANRVWLQRDWPVEPGFLQILDQEYQAPVGEADFRTQPGLADFSGIYTGPEPALHLTAARHKAFVNVNETGLEAAAATGIVGGITSAYPVMVVARLHLDRARIRLTPVERVADEVACFMRLRVEAAGN